MSRVHTWGEKASALYDHGYAQRYRDHDEALGDCVPYRNLVDWLQSICERFPAPVAVLDVGCGTGRYFWALRGVSDLTGLDASTAMLEQAARPVHGHEVTVETVTLVQGDLMTHHFAPASFDLVYSIGVLAEHVPLDATVVARVHCWLRAGGRFAFTTVHPDSPSVPQTLMRRIARGASRLLPSAMIAPLRSRLLVGGLYADEQRVRELLRDVFVIESLERFQSEAHLHCRCVAQKLA